MSLRISFLNLPVMQTLAWALVHFVWQGAVLAVAAAAKSSRDEAYRTLRDTLTIGPRPERVGPC